MKIATVNQSLQSTHSHIWRDQPEVDSTWGWERAVFSQESKP